MKERRWKKLYGSHISFVCPYCLKTFPLSESTKDHVIPRKKKKKTVPENIVLSCKSCNSQKGALTPDEYKDWLRLEYIRNGGLSR